MSRKELTKTCKDGFRLNRTLWSQWFIQRIQRFQGEYKCDDMRTQRSERNNIVQSKMLWRWPNLYQKYIYFCQNIFAGRPIHFHCRLLWSHIQDGFVLNYLIYSAPLNNSTEWVCLLSLLIIIIVNKPFPFIVPVWYFIVHWLQHSLVYICWCLVN